MKKEQMLLAGIAGYMMMNRGNSGLGGFGQAQSTEQAPTGYAVPSTWTQMDFNKSMQQNDPYKNTKFYAHEIYAWYTTRVFTNNPGDRNASPVWENIAHKLRRQPNFNFSPDVKQGSPQMTRIETAMRAPDGHFYVWKKRYLLAVAAAVEKEILAKVQPIANNLITTTEFLNQVVIPAASILRNYSAGYQKGFEALMKTLRA